MTVKLQESEDVLVLIYENKLKLAYDTLGLAAFLILGLVLANSSNGLDLTDDELMSGWFTALGGIGFCLLLIFTNEYATRWIFDKTSSCFVVEYQGIRGCRRFRSSLEKVQAIKVAFLGNGGVEIVLPDLDLSMRKIPVEKVSNYATTIKDFLNLDDAEV